MLTYDLATLEPATPVRATDGALVFDFESETLGAEPKSVIPTVGQWIAGVDGKERVLVVDGRGWSRGQPSAGLADKARALYGERYAEFRKLYPSLDGRVAQKHIASYLGMTPEFLSTVRKRVLAKG